MPFYPDAAVLHACLDRLLDCVQQQSPDSLSALRAARLSARFRFSAPNAVFYFDGRRTPLRAVVGVTATVRPDLEVALAGDTLHQVLLGKLTLASAVGDQLIRVRGPVWKVYPLGDIFLAGRRYYPQILGELKLI